jgi:hypothetical protein
MNTPNETKSVRAKPVLDNPQILLDKEYLTIEETVKLFGIHENTLYLSFKRGELKPPVKHFQRNYLKSSDLLEYTVRKFGKDTVSKWLGRPVQTQ